MLKLLADFFEEDLDGFLITFEEVPLTMFLAGNQARSLQRCQVGRDRRLRQAAELIKLSGAHAMFGGVDLVRERGIRIFESVENFSAYWVCQGFYYFVEVNRHGGSAQWVQRYIAMRRTLNRCIAIYKYENDLRSVQIGISGYNDMDVAVLNCAP